MGKIYKVKQRVAQQTAFTITKGEPSLQKRLQELNKQIWVLKEEQRAVVKALKYKNKLKRVGKLQTVKLYSLRLEDGYYYVGMSFNPENRFIKHTKGKGAKWTKLHPPVDIMETRDTGLFDQDEVAKMEDDMAIEYALKYGLDRVRGGGYCQTKPTWPKELYGPDLSWIG